jgi:hypothetical protein
MERHQKPVMVGEGRENVQRTTSMPSPSLDITSMIDAVRCYPDGLGKASFSHSYKSRDVLDMMCGSQESRFSRWGLLAESKEV